MQSYINLSPFQRLVGVVSIAMLVGACANATTAVSATPIGSALPTDLIRAVEKDNGSGITVSYRVEPNVIANQPTTIVVVFNALKGAGTARFSSDNGLKLSGITTAPVALPKGGSQLVLQATAKMDGLLYVNVFTAYAGATSVISIPVKVGDTAPKTAIVGKSKSMPNGERIISMPVP